MASGRPATSTNQAERHEQSFRPLKRTRGGNLNWKQVAVHDSLEIALSHYSTERLIEKDLIKGKIAGTKTLVYNFSCGKKTCGCRKQYRLTTVQCAVEVIEEETFGEHENHDQYQRNNGRGLSYAQSSIVEDAIRNNLTKTQQVIDYFAAIAEEGVRREGLHYCIVPSPSATQIFNYMAYRKRLVVKSAVNEPVSLHVAASAETAAPPDRSP